MARAKIERTKAAELAKSGYIMPPGYDEGDERALALAGEKPKVPKTKEQEAAEKAAAGPEKVKAGAAPSEIKIGAAPSENKAATVPAKKSKKGKKR